MFKYTKHTLKKIEEFFSEIEYTIRYERGNFQSGYCLVENRKIAVINKFFDIEARINCLLDILSTITVDEEDLEDASKVFYHKLRKFSTSTQEENKDDIEEENKDDVEEEIVTETEKTK